MTAQASEYSHAAHIKNVTQAARAAGLKGAAFAVLAYLCAAADYKKPTVRVSKATICDRTGYCLKTVKAVLAELRGGGFLDPVAYATGGRERATVYVLRTGKGGENLPPFDAAEIAKGGKKLPVKGGKNFPQRGEKTTPPSIVSSYVSSEREGGAYRDGIGNAAPLDEAGRQEAATFAREHREHGLYEALDRAKARREAKAASGELP